MPYKIETNKDGTFSVVNKESGRRLSKGTTKEKAKKQIKAVYANTQEGGKLGGDKGMMKPNHKVRYLVSLLKDRIIKNPLHKKILDFSKEALKREEINGAGFWDDMWSGIKNVLAFPAQVIQEVPFVKDAVSFLFPEAKPILDIVPQFTKYIYGDDTNQWLSDLLSDVPYAGDVRSDKGYKTSDELRKTPVYKADVPRYDKHLSNNTSALNNNSARSPYALSPNQEQMLKNDQEKQQDLLDRQRMNIYGEQSSYTERLAKTLEHIEQITPQLSDTPYEPYAVPLFNPISYDSHGHVIPVDNALRFPMIYNYSNTDQPKNLQDFLISNGVAGKDFSLKEYGNVIDNQRPYAFLDYPINGGSVRKINYNKNCF